MHDKLFAKKQQFIARTAKIFNWSEEEAIERLSRPLQSAIRANALRDFTKSDLTELAKKEGWQVAELDWSPDAVLLVSDKSAVTHHRAFEEGKVYLQNPASFLPVLALDPRPGHKILDMAAAPGGKASHIASITRNQAEITVNDNSRPRLAKMRANFERMNVQTAEVLLSTFERLPKQLDEASFDKILLDAPCSGEGLINPDNLKDFTYWSTAQVKRLSAQQKRAIRIAWRLLKPGGTLVYSTCTMAPEENEVVIDYLLRHEEDATLAELPIRPKAISPALKSWNDKQFKSDLQRTMRIQPGSGMEAFYIAKIQKVL